ncbi:TetR/AcrR family transcriptional regulator [Kutzneria sp. CA-103260]|uniref:TetR/AcrR family transcriptional regulator n=1 Tax=Kutzneria sp. CA-103260 TaxID=2802641 RepID=UPI001BAD9232|nr:TetR/AcrR family transcriptional regulator [Kutzneria sp. CA-103260]QUQ68063.1 TetR family transcriptional regulator [Kutzneria sp. CA-103260]
MTSEAPEHRRRDASATKAALLRAAQELFTERGYERTTVRDIADRAGVNQALLFRYYGSKEDLFHVVLATESRVLVTESPAEQVLAKTLARMLSPDRAEAQESVWLAALRSSGHDSAADAIRKELSQDYVRALGSLTEAGDADLRVDLVLAWLVGLGTLRSVVRKEPLVSADPEAVTRLMLKAVAVLLERVDTDPVG